MCALQAIRKGLRRLQNSGFGKKKFGKISILREKRKEEEKREKKHDASFFVDQSPLTGNSLTKNDHNWIFF